MLPWKNSWFQIAFFAWLVSGALLLVDYAPKVPVIGDWSKVFQHAPSRPSQAPAQPVPSKEQSPAKAPTQVQQAPTPSSKSQAPPIEHTAAKEPLPAQPNPETVLWKAIANSTNPSDFRAYLQQYPNGAFVSLARHSLANLQKGKGPQLYSQAKDLYNKSDFPGAAAYYQQACDVQYAVACLDLGDLYVFGQGVSRNSATAAQFYQKACDGENARACFLLGNDYMASGLGVTPAPSTAAYLFNKACRAGEAQACASLGYQYLNGMGTPKDIGSAVQFYQKSCDGGFNVGCANLADLYETGQGVTQNKATASQLYQKSCALGYQTACGK